MAGSAGLDRGLVHGLHAGGPDRGELRGVDRLQQADRALGDMGEPGAADGDPGRFQPLVLAVQRQVPGKFVDQETGGEAHIGPTAFEDRRRGGHGVDRLAGFELDHRAAVLQYLVAPRALRQAVGDLLPDDLVLIGRQSPHRIGHQHNGLHRHLRLIEEGQRLTLGAVRGHHPARVRRDRLALIERRLRDRQHLT